MEVKIEDEEDEFRSCCADEEELKERDELVKLGFENDDLDEFSIRMFFKGVSILTNGCGLSGIGVFMERVKNVPIIQVQKKLEFYADEAIVDYLALMDGLSEAAQNNIKRVFAFTDSRILVDQITNDETLENPLLMALKQRILEHVENLEHFVLKHVPDTDVESPLRLAQVAIGIVQFSTKFDEKSIEKCSICSQETPKPMMVTLKCSHNFCSNCTKTHVSDKIHSSQIPIPCPHPKCRYYISTLECKSFLPVASYESLNEALSKPNVIATDKFYCPFSSCSVLLDPRSEGNLGNSSDNNCIECPVCRRFICVKCGVPWHSSMNCDEFQVVATERDVGEVAMDCIAENRGWRRCRMCERMIELTHGCYHMTCWCGHEFCYSCGTEYTESQQACECAFWDEEEEENDSFTPSPTTNPTQNFEEWAWDSFGSLSNMMDAYSDQERSQLALIQRFLAGGFSLSDHHPSPPFHHQSPPRSCSNSESSYLENTIKDLHQLPWLERFVSVISDNYYDEYTQEAIQ